MAMNNLYESLLEWVEIGGHSYRLNLSFDNVLLFFKLMKDKEIGDVEKTIIAFENFVPDFDLDGHEPHIVVAYAAETVQTIIAYLMDDDADSGKQVDPEDPEDPEENDDAKFYCLDEDAPYIYASFMQEYSIDLYEMQDKLHWCKFKALLNGLRDDTKFKEIVGIRSAKLPVGKEHTEERKRLKTLKAIYALKSTQSETDGALDALFNKLSGGQ